MTQDPEATTPWWKTSSGICLALMTISTFATFIAWMLMEYSYRSRELDSRDKLYEARKVEAELEILKKKAGE